MWNVGANDSGNRSVVVLGAGPTGLGAALGITLNASSPIPVTVLEKKATVGGLAGSYDWRGHTIDYGPHRLSSNIDAVRYLVEEILGPDCLVKKSQHGVVLKRKAYQFPPRTVDWISPFSLFLLLRMFCSFVFAKFSWIVHRFESDTFESLMVKSFGRTFYEEIVVPMSTKIWIEPASIDPTFVNLRFSLIRPSVVLKKLIFPKQELNPANFFYPRRGFQQLWSNIHRSLQLDGVKFELEAEPYRIVVQDNQVTEIHYRKNGKEHVVSAKNTTVVSTIPLPRLVSILEGIDRKPLEEKISRIKVRSLYLVSFEFDQPKTLPFRTIILPEKEFIFNRLFEQNEYSRDTVSPGKSVVVADITFDPKDALQKATDEEIIAKTKEGLAKLSFLPLGKISAAAVKRVEYAYVVPDTTTRTEFLEIQHSLKEVRNLVVAGRFGAGEYDNSDYAIDNGLTLGAMITGRISRLEHLTRSRGKLGRSIVG